MLSSRNRTGSPSALNIRARSPAQSRVSGSRTNGLQHGAGGAIASLWFDMRQC